MHEIAMSLSEFERRRIAAILADYCERRVPAHVRDRVRMGFAFRGDTVTLHEEQPGFQDPTRWIRSPIAQFRRHKTTRAWQLFWLDRNRRWHAYTLIPAAREFVTLLQEVDRDSTRIFYG